MRQKSISHGERYLKRISFVRQIHAVGPISSVNRNKKGGFKALLSPFEKVRRGRPVVPLSG
jgi:hypothetical protein